MATYNQQTGYGNQHTLKVKNALPRNWQFLVSDLKVPKVTLGHFHPLTLCPCGDGVIQLFKGSDSTLQQSHRENLKVFLKGSKKRKQLKRMDPNVYRLFESVWKIRERHVVTGSTTVHLFSTLLF